MKSLAFLPLAFSLLLPSSVLALPSRTIFAEQAQGFSGSGINLEVPPGYGLTLNFIETGEVVKQAWIGDPSRFVFSSNGNLCPQGLQDSNCTNTGATVIFLRQIKPVDFPGLVSSSDGGTQLTLITEGSEGQKQYSFGLSAVSIGKPKYTTLIIKPDEQKFVPLPIPSRQIPTPTAPPSVLDQLPTVTSSVQRQQRTLVQNYTSKVSTATTTRQRPPVLPKKQLEQPLSIPIPVPSPSLSRENTTEINRIPEEPTRRVRAPTLKRIPTFTNLPTRSAQQRVTTPKRRSSSLTIHQQSKVAHGSLSAVKPHSRAAKLKKAPVSPPRVRIQRSSVATNSPAVRVKKNLQQSIDDANAIAFGLRTANENGQIKAHTLMWRKAQSAIRLLRGGKTTEEAAQIAKISPATLAQLIKWGQERP